MKVFDLFAGCGGFSLGFEQAGFQSVLALEIDEWASETYSANHPETKIITSDIREVALSRLELPAIDGVIGGSPCQGFSLSGSRDPRDPRNSLFMEFVRFVRELQPKFFVMENVLGLLSMKTREQRTTMSWEKYLSQYQQIGNAVPPLLAQAIAATVRRYMGQISEIDDTLSADVQRPLQFA